MFYFKIVIVYKAGQVTYLFQKQENIHPEKWIEIQKWE